MLGVLFFNNPIAVVVLASCAFPAEKYYRKLLARRRRHQLAIEFKDLLLSLSASFQAGRQMREALFEAQENLSMIYAKDALLNMELAQMTRRISGGGESERDALFDFANRSQSEDIRSFADIYHTCLTTGGDMVKAINRTTDVLVEKMAIRREIEALTAQKKYESKILTGVPILILAFLRLNSPDYLSPLYTTIVGNLIMTGALLALIAAYVWSDRIMEIEV
jgi:tight adherence protein B